ncbi:MAG: SRPBCC family protein [Pseudomonadota bacterium]
MKFNAQEDVEAPLDFVFSRVTDYQSLERSALRRGAEVQRLDDLPLFGVGMEWDTVFELRGKRRQMRLHVTQCEAPNFVEVLGNSKNIKGLVNVDLVALSRGRTRISVALEMNPKTLSARLLVQSLKLARATMTKQFRARVASYADDIEDRFRART